MSVAELFFLVVGALAAGSAVAMLLASNTVHAALFLLVILFAVAMLYLTLAADFLFAIQLLVYAGAILVLFLFVITLLNPAGESALAGIRGRAVSGLALCAALVLEGALLLRDTDLPAAAAPRQIPFTEIGEALFTRYLFPFEAVSLLLLVAVVGAMVLGRRWESGPARALRRRKSRDTQAAPRPGVRA